MPDADQVAKEALARVHARIERMNRITYLVGQLGPAELEGMIVLAEAAVAERRPLVGLTRATADEGMAYMLPPGAF